MSMAARRQLLACALGLLIAPLVTADVVPFNYRLGTVAVTESEHRIVVHALPPIAVDILPGGKSWPILSLDESGAIRAGATVVDAVTAAASTDALATLVLPHGVRVVIEGDDFVFRQAGRRCVLSPRTLGLGKGTAPLTALQNRHIALISSEKALLALVLQFDANGDSANYLTEKIDIRRCRVAARQSIGNPDLLIELGHTARGGWWITGSIEQTLLQSRDGRHWRQASLPPGLSSLISAYVVSPREIWLAGILDAAVQSPYLLVHSEDGGRSWRNVMAGDSLLLRVPVGWLEGQKRRAQAPAG